jgi:hypothetical protein
VSERCVALFCGSRDWKDWDRIEEDVAQLPAGCIVIHGGQRGADTMAGKIAHDMGIHVAAMPWLPKFYGKAAGPKRNAALMALMPTVGYAYPLLQSRGTWDMVRKLKRANVPVFVAHEVLA